MEFEMKRRIELPADQVWEELWGKYHNVCDWASTVNKSGPRQSNKDQEEGRTCISTWGEISEIVNEVNEKEMTFSYYADGLPPVMKSADNHWRVRALTHKSCEVAYIGEIKFAAIPGFLMGWMMKPKLRKDLNQTLDDFKHYVETGRQTVAKKKSDAKFKKKTR